MCNLDVSTLLQVPIIVLMEYYLITSWDAWFATRFPVELHALANATKRPI
jgi:hypothetical protein